MTTKAKEKPVFNAETYKVPSVISGAIRKEIENFTSSLNETIVQQQNEIAGLKAQLKAYESIPISTEQGGKSAIRNIFDSIPDNNKFEALNLLFSKIYQFSFGDTFRNSDLGRIPMAFKLHVYFYNNRFQIYDFLDEAGIKYDSWLKQVILPHEWPKENLSLFVDTIKNHYCCNGQTFSNNFEYWYNEHKERLTNPVEQMKHNYSEIPWQIILLNPLWADDELIDKIIAVMDSDNYRSSNIRYFERLPEFCKELTDEQIVKIVLRSNDDDKFKQIFRSSRVRAAIFNSKNDTIYKRIFKLNLIDSDSPFEFQMSYINQMGFDEAIQYIRRNKVFSEPEKAELIGRTVKKEYSKEAILDRVMSL